MKRNSYSHWIGPNADIMFFEEILSYFFRYFFCIPQKKYNKIARISTGISLKKHDITGKYSEILHASLQ